VAVTTLHDSLDYLSRQRDAEAARQRHAEVMAWAGVAVFVALMVVVITTLPHPDSTVWVFRTGVEVALALAFLITLGYARRQFNERDWACRIARAYDRALSATLETDGPAAPAGTADLGPSTPPYGATTPPPASAPGRRWGGPWGPAATILFPPRLRSEDAALETHPDIVRRSVPDACPAGASTEFLAYSLLVVAFVVASVVALSLSPSKPSAITSPGATTFHVGIFGSFTITTSGSPTPRLSESGALPAGVTFTDDGNGTATVSGTPGPGSAGRYEIQVTAANGVAPDATQDVAIRVTGPGSPRTRAGGGTVPGSFTSAATASATRGSPFTFEIAASGSPPPRIKVVGRLPRGITFHDNRNGTASLSGVPTNHHPGVFHLRLKAVFGSGRARQVAVQLFALSVG